MFIYYTVLYNRANTLSSYWHETWEKHEMAWNILTSLHTRLSCSEDLLLVTTGSVIQILLLSRFVPQQLGTIDWNHIPEDVLDVFPSMFFANGPPPHQQRQRQKLDEVTTGPILSSLPGLHHSWALLGLHGSRDKNAKVDCLTTQNYLDMYASWGNRKSQPPTPPTWLASLAAAAALLEFGRQTHTRAPWIHDDHPDPDQPAQSVDCPQP